MSLNLKIRAIHKQLPLRYVVHSLIWRGKQ